MVCAVIGLLLVLTFHLLQEMFCSLSLFLSSCSLSPQSTYIARVSVPSSECEPPITSPACDCLPPVNKGRGPEGTHSPAGEGGGGGPDSQFGRLKKKPILVLGIRYSVLVTVLASCSLSLVLALSPHPNPVFMFIYHFLFAVSVSLSYFFHVADQLFCDLVLCIVPAHYVASLLYILF